MLFEALSAIVDSLAFGIIICDPTGLVLFANRVADQLAGAGHGIMFATSPSGRVLTASKPAERRAFGDLIKEAASGSESGIRLSAHESFALVIAAPIELRADDSIQQAVQVLIAAEQKLTAAVESRLISIFKLSPTQAALAVALYNGETLAAFAGSRNNKLTTVRSHLSRIFLKTGTRNQADLMRLISTVPHLAYNTRTAR
jgi:DNA-binding CsgD family transcriptional regulator